MRYTIEVKLIAGSETKFLYIYRGGKYEKIFQHRVDNFNYDRPVRYAGKFRFHVVFQKTILAINGKRGWSMKGKVVIISGAASGIGAETALLLAKNGASLVIADINEQALAERVKELRTIHDYVVAGPLDVRKRESWESILKTGTTAFGTADVLINCAGVADPEPLHIIPEELMRNQVDVNLTGAMLGTQVMLKYFLKRQKGHIIHIASLAALAPLPDQAAYTASKFGLRGFCLALDLELRKSPVNISIICPDAVNTPMLVHEAMNGVSSLVFSGSLLHPDRVAMAVLKTIQKPKREVLVPRYRGWLSKLACAAPWVLSFMFPVMDRIGKRNLNEYVKECGMREVATLQSNFVRKQQGEREYHELK